MKGWVGLVFSFKSPAKFKGKLDVFQVVVNISGNFPEHLQPCWLEPGLNIDSTPTLGYFYHFTVHSLADICSTLHWDFSEVFLPSVHLVVQDQSLGSTAVHGCTWHASIIKLKNILFWNTKCMQLLISCLWIFCTISSYVVPSVPLCF